MLLSAALLATAAAAQVRPFSHPTVARDAERYESYLRANVKPGPQKTQELTVAGRRALSVGGDARGASRSFALAVVTDPNNADAWLGLADALLATQPDPRLPSERYDLPVHASGAAYRAYERASSPAVKARALAVLGEALKRRSYWRPAIEALKASLALAENAEVRRSYEALRSEHGFRLVDYSVEQESPQPRLCIQFSERLQSEADLAKFVAVDGQDPQGLVRDGRQLCIEGLSHGKRYEVVVRAGLPSDVGEVLEKPAELAIYVRDRSPSLRFSGRSYVLPSRGQAGIPVVTVNTERITFEIYRIGDRGLASAINSGDFQRQLSMYEVEQLKERIGAKVYAGSMEVARKLNQEVTTAVPVADAVTELKPGVYVMVARAAEVSADSETAQGTQWFIVSDLGLTAFSGEDGIHAFVRSLATTRPIADVKVRLVARNNEVLGEARADAQGYARFEPGLARGEGGMAPAVLVAEGAGTDYAFLDLTASAFDLSDRGVKGREAPGPLDAFLYTDRGVYRPGEDVHLTALVRNRNGAAAPVPTTLVVVRPDGVEHRRIAMLDQGLGGRTTTLGITASAMTGTWRARLYVDPKSDPLASIAFLVEDFVPERLELKLEPAVTALIPDERGIIKVAGRYLYGPPAANLALEGDIIVRPTGKDLEGYPGYRFGLASEKISPVRQALEDLPSSDAQGRAEINLRLPPIPRTAQPLEANVVVRMREPSGRTVEGTVVLPVELREPRIGVKPLFANAQIGEGETASFDVILLGPDGRRAPAKGLKWELMRLETRWQWYNRDGQWAYEAVTLTRKAAAGTVDVAADQPARISAKVDWGRYRLDVTSAEPGGPASSLIFNAGWYADEAAESPEMLDVALDKPSYRPGDTAKLKIATRQGGKALVTVLGNGLLMSREVEVPQGGGEVPLSVGSNWDPGAYVTVMLYRPLDETAKRMASRAVGVKWLGIDQTARTLSVALTPEAKVRSGAELAVPVKVGGLAPGEDARITIAAVDLGILNLTRFQPPAPEAWFNAQRRLGTEIRDFYGRLIDGMRAERGKLRSGGDADEGLSLQGSPATDTMLALFSGLVQVGPDGAALVRFQLPQFNGTVRLMAVAWSADKVGHGTADVIVRDAIALLATGPRFMTLGDEAGIEVDVHNVELGAGTIALAVEQESPDGTRSTILSRELPLGANQRKAERFRVKPDQVGRFAYDITITGPAGLDVRRRLSFEVKPPAGDIRRATVSQLAPGGALILTPDLFHDLLPERSRLSVSVGPLAALDVPGLLTQLDRYPYGCAEQTTSRALPLLYANQLAVQTGLPADRELKERIAKAIDRVFEMQDASGAFGVWGPGNGDMWLTSYVTEFLTRAKEQGFAIKPQQFALALDRLQNFVGYAQDFERGGEARAYALYVLARNGRAPIGEARYYADTRLDRFATPLAKAQLGAALAMLGDRERAARVFQTALAADTSASATALRLDYGSMLRDSAAVLTLASETGIVRDSLPRLAGTLARAYSARSQTSTQEQAWMLLAARALLDARDAALSVNGQPHTGALNATFTPAELKDGRIAIRNEGAAPVDAMVSVTGTALTPEPPVAKGFKIERAYYTLDGKLVDPKSLTGGSAQLRQTDRFVVVLKIEADQPGGRILVVDRLPAGLEIENPRLLESADLKSFTWLNMPVKPEHTEFRDDRFVAAFNFYGRTNEGEDDASASGPVSSATVAYMVRAVSPGSYIHPAATVEDMYRPDRFARTASGKLEVVRREQ